MKKVLLEMGSTSIDAILVKEIITGIKGAAMWLAVSRREAVWARLSSSGLHRSLFIS